MAHLATSFNRMSREVERSQQSLRDFLADASHELRTPLTSIQGFSQALLDGALAGDEAGSSEAGRIINEESQRMRLLVEDLLYLSRVESRQVSGTQAPVDVGALLREVLAPAAAHGRAAQPGHPAHATRPACRCWGTPTSSTASSATSWRTPASTPPRGRHPGRRGRAGGEALVVTVHNTGSAIPPEDLPHVFERFYRVDKSRARDVEGSGLGLAIAQEVAQRHRGRIEVQSDPRQRDHLHRHPAPGDAVRSRRPGVEAPAGDRAAPPARRGASLG